VALRYRDPVTSKWSPPPRGRFPSNSSVTSMSIGRGSTGRCRKRGPSRKRTCWSRKRPGWPIRGNGRRRRGCSARPRQGWPPPLRPRDPRGDGSCGTVQEHSRHDGDMSSESAKGPEGDQVPARTRRSSNGRGLEEAGRDRVPSLPPRDIHRYGITFPASTTVAHVPTALYYIRCRDSLTGGDPDAAFDPYGRRGHGISEIRHS